MDKLNHKIRLIYQRAKIHVFLNIFCVFFGLVSSDFIELIINNLISYVDLSKTIRD